MDEREALGMLAAELPAAGDDAAVVGDAVLTTDMLHETTDFPPGVDRYTAGWRAVAASLSDVAAMGAAAEAAVAVYGAPTFDATEIRAFVRGARDACESVDAAYVGGDLDETAEFTVATTALGRTTDPIRRDGLGAVSRRPAGGATESADDDGIVGDGLSADDNTAVDNDVTADRDTRVDNDATADGDTAVDNAVCVTGALGRTAAALRLFDRGETERANDLFRFPPRVAAGRALAPYATAGMDVSDGLARSLHQLAAANDCGFAVSGDDVPIHEAVTETVDGDAERLAAATTVGEDFELLCTVPEECVADARADCPVPLSRIGTVTESSVTLDGDPLADEGWTHGG